MQVRSKWMVFTLLVLVSLVAAHSGTAQTLLTEETFDAGLPASWFVYRNSATGVGGYLDLNYGCVVLPETYSRQDGLRIEADINIRWQGAGDFNYFIFWDPRDGAGDPSLPGYVGSCDHTGWGYEASYYPVGSDNPVDYLDHWEEGLVADRVSTPTRIAAGTWSTVAVELYPSGDIKSFINGVETLHLFNSVESAGPLTLRSWGSVWVDNVRIWSLGPEDTDGDGVPDDDDICPGGDDLVDTDGDEVPDFCDPCPFDSENDADGDGVCGDVDLCPSGDDGLNQDGDGLPDACDVCPADPENDADGDGLCESDDNCSQLFNPEQTDTDQDGSGDLCDGDDDDDGIADPGDNCPLQANPSQTDTDGDGIGDLCDGDDDGDGVIDGDDQCPASETGSVVSPTGCSIAQLCPCDYPIGGSQWKNHGAYVRCVARTAEVFVELALISESEKDEIVSGAAQSTCGKKN